MLIEISVSIVVVCFIAYGLWIIFKKDEPVPSVLDRQIDTKDDNYHVFIPIQYEITPKVKSTLTTTEMKKPVKKIKKVRKPRTEVTFSTEADKAKFLKNKAKIFKQMGIKCPE